MWKKVVPGTVRRSITSAAKPSSMPQKEPYKKLEADDRSPFDALGSLVQKLEADLQHLLMLQHEEDVEVTEHKADATVLQSLLVSLNCNKVDEYPADQDGQRKVWMLAGIDDREAEFLQEYTDMEDMLNSLVTTY